MDGRSKNTLCFLDIDNKPIILKKSSPDFDAKLKADESKFDMELSEKQMMVSLY